MNSALYICTNIMCTLVLCNMCIMQHVHICLTQVTTRLQRTME